MGEMTAGMSARDAAATTDFEIQGSASWADRATSHTITEAMGRPEQVVHRAAERRSVDSVSSTLNQDAVTSFSRRNIAEKLLSVSTPVKPTALQGLVVGLSKWEGRILDIEGGMFSAELSPLDHEGPMLLANFQLQLLERDGEEVVPGDMFYLTTRIVRDRVKSSSTSSLQLRRAAKWSREELDAARARARRIAEALDLDAD